MKRRRKSMLSSILDLFQTSNLVDGRYDKLAFRYVSYVALPALAIYAIYSLVYDTHRSWYSFVISTLTSFVYMFGFVRVKVFSITWSI
jgi:hypothetical protein